MKELIVNVENNEKKLNTYLLESFPSLKTGMLFKALRQKDIRINGKKIHENVTIHTGDSIQIYIADEYLFSSNTLDMRLLSIVYEDNYILLANKPSGIEVVGENSLTTIVKEYLNQKQKDTYVEPCHRIDRNTMGLVLFAKTPEALSILLQKFKDHEIEKHYLTKVHGILKQKQARLEAYLFKDKKKSLVYISDIPKKGYLKIITSYQVVNELKQEQTSILDITLETGRTHQIRAHLAHLGHPIIGDGKYGNNQINKQFHQKTQQLYSYQICFCFRTPSGILSYLNGQTFHINCPLGPGTDGQKCP